MKFNDGSKAVTGAVLMAWAMMIAPGLYANDSPTQTTSVIAAKDKVGEKASKLIGEDVRSTTHEDLGKVKDLVIDVRDGRVVYALISSGGILGIGETIHIVPFSSFKSGTPSDGALVLDLQGSSWANAPIVDGKDLSMYAKSADGMNVYRHYGRDWEKDLGQSAMKGSEKSSPLMRVSDLKGMEVHNGTQKVGKIENIFVNFDRHHASALLDPSDDFTGTNQNFAVSFAKLSPAPSEKDGFMTSLTRSDFKNATPFRDTNLTMTELYPYEWSYTATYMPIFPIERTPIAQVRSVLKEDPVIGTAMKDVKLSTHDDQLTLTGQVQSQELKTQVANRVETVAKGWDVTNKLSVGLASK